MNCNKPDVDPFYTVISTLIFTLFSIELAPYQALPQRLSVAHRSRLCFPCSFRTKALVLELLAAVCLVRGGHEIILSAFDNFKEVRAAQRGEVGSEEMSLHFNCNFKR